jgi:hypothetical protein
MTAKNYELEDQDKNQKLDWSDDNQKYCKTHKRNYHLKCMECEKTCMTDITNFLIKMNRWQSQGIKPENPQKKLTV